MSAFFRERRSSPIPFGGSGNERLGFRLFAVTARGASCFRLCVSVQKSSHTRIIEETHGDQVCPLFASFQLPLLCSGPARLSSHWRQTCPQSPAKRKTRGWSRKMRGYKRRLEHYLQSLRFFEIPLIFCNCRLSSEFLLLQVFLVGT